MSDLGYVVRIYRYPVKSMAGEEVREIYIHESGLNGDRIFSLYDKESKRSGLPYFTGREKGKLLLFRPRIINEKNVAEDWPQDFRPKVVVQLEDIAKELDIESPEFMEFINAFSGRELVLDYKRAGMQDSKPVSIIGLSSVRQIGYESGNPELDLRRFRENLYIDWGDTAPFYEDSLVGKSIQVGGAVLHIAKRNERCPMICTHPDSAVYDKSVLAAVAKNHDKNAGVLAIIRKQGIVCVGDKVICP